MSELPGRKRRIGTLIIGILAAIWVTAGVSGQRVMLNYDYTAATAGGPPSKWPHESLLPRTRGVPTIVVVAHPHCPCSRATVEQLDRLIARLQGHGSAVVGLVRQIGRASGMG